MFLASFSVGRFSEVLFCSGTSCNNNFLAVLPFHPFIDPMRFGEFQVGLSIIDSQCLIDLMAKFGEAYNCIKNLFKHLSVSLSNKV